MVSKKISRKQLLKEPDEFLTFSARAIAFAAEHRQRIAISAGTVAALALILVAFNMISERNRMRALDLLNSAIVTYQQTATIDGPEKGYTAVADQYRQLLAEYGGTKAGRLGRWVFAGNCLAAAKYDEAVELFQSTLDDLGDLAVSRAVVLTGLGHAHMGKSQWDKAAEAFESAKAVAGGDTGSEVLFQLGLVYERLGQSEKSRQAFEQVVADYADTVYAGMARERMGAASKKGEG